MTNRHIPADALKGAIGDRDCDSITIENQFAHVTISLLLRLPSDLRSQREYEVTGDVMSEHRQTRGRRFCTAQEAYAYALACLALYVAGRAD